MLVLGELSKPAPLRLQNGWVLVTEWRDKYFLVFKKISKFFFNKFAGFFQV